MLQHKFFFFQNKKMDADVSQQGKTDKKPVWKNERCSREIENDGEKKRVAGMRKNAIGNQHSAVVFIQAKTERCFKVKQR